MPELPEVETVVRSLRRQSIVGHRISAVEIGWKNSVGGDPDLFTTRVRGVQLTSIRRRGKYIVIGTDGTQTIVVHLRMSGRLWITPYDHQRSGYERVILTLDDGREIRFHDPRKFGRFLATERPEVITDKLGFEPLGGTIADREDKWRKLAARRRMIKALLLDQHVIAGLGNIYVDEALWQAGIHPARRANDLSEQEVSLLRLAVETVLNLGIQNRGTALGGGLSNFVPADGNERSTNQNYLSVFRRTGQACPRCGETVDRLRVAGRSTHICPRCQPTTEEIRRSSSA